MSLHGRLVVAVYGDSDPKRRKTADHVDPAATLSRVGMDDTDYKHEQEHSCSHPACMAVCALES
jgi:hypothetical protein